MRYVALAGRQLFSILFIVASAGHFSQQTIETAGHHGVPLAGLLVPLSGVIALMGGLSILVGFQTRLGAWMLVIFLIPVTVLMHNFWSEVDPTTFQIEKAMFMKNITMLGGALLISYFGAGPLSLDAFVYPREHVAHEARIESSVRASDRFVEISGGSASRSKEPQPSQFHERSLESAVHGWRARANRPRE